MGLPIQIEPAAGWQRTPSASRHHQRHPLHPVLGATELSAQTTSVLSSIVPVPSFTASSFCNK